MTRKISRIEKQVVDNDGKATRRQADRQALSKKTETFWRLDWRSAAMTEPLRRLNWKPVVKMGTFWWPSKWQGSLWNQGLLQLRRSKDWELLQHRNAPTWQEWGLETASAQERGNDTA